MSYEAIVVGCGGVGSAALYHLARRGVRVVGLDQHPPGHALGSSHGQTRIIRLAYFEHPDYVPLLRRAYALWEDLSEQAAQPLFVRTGLVQAGPADGDVITGVLRSAAEHGLAVERLEPTDAAARFPGHAFDDGELAVYERDAGYLLVEDCVRAHLRLAEAAGAEVRTGVTVEGLAPTADGGVAVRTADGTMTADRVVVTAGAWAARLLADVGMSLRVLRKHVYWYAADPGWDATAGAPAFLHERPGGVFYGIPSVDGRGVKVAEHSGGDLVADPDAVDRADDPVARERVAAFVRGRLRGVGPATTAHEVCLYTMSPDGHFVVDRHPGVPGVVFAAGLSGHGFKFTAVLGEVLADLATRAASPLPHQFLSIRG